MSNPTNLTPLMKVALLDLGVSCRDNGWDFGFAQDMCAAPAQRGALVAALSNADLLQVIEEDCGVASCIVLTAEGRKLAEDLIRESMIIAAEQEGMIDR